MFVSALLRESLCVLCRIVTLRLLTTNFSKIIISLVDHCFNAVASISIDENRKIETMVSNRASKWFTVIFESGDQLDVVSFLILLFTSNLLS